MAVTRTSTESHSGESGPVFASGSAVALRSINTYGDRGLAVGFTVAGRVIVDSPALTVVATTVGSDVRKRAGPGSGPNARLVLPADWDGSYNESEWFGAAVVRVHLRNQPWSVWRWHDGTTWQPDWYVNLETPWARTPLGFDSQDWTLDIVAREAEGRWSVEYKDVDELAFLESTGDWAPERAQQIRAAGQHAHRVATARSWPFDADWDDWLPEDKSPVALSPGWDRLDATP